MKIRFRKDLKYWKKSNKRSNLKVSFKTWNQKKRMSLRELDNIMMFIKKTIRMRIKKS